MKKKQLEELVKNSYSKNNLDEKKVKKTSQSLTRMDLKRYIRMLKSSENKNSVIISSAAPLKDDQKRTIKSLFPNKKIFYNIDKSLIAGIKVKDNDLLYEMDFKNSLNNLLSHISGASL